MMKDLPIGTTHHDCDSCLRCRECGRHYENASDLHQHLSESFQCTFENQHKNDKKTPVLDDNQRNIVVNDLNDDKLAYEVGSLVMSCGDVFNEQGTDITIEVARYIKKRIASLS